MKSPLFLLLCLCAYQAGGVHLPRTSGAAAGSSNTTAAAIPVAVVMFDQTYMKLFDCFLRYWAKQINSAEHKNKLDIVVYDTVAYRHAENVIRTYPAGMVRQVQLHELSPRARRTLRRGAPSHGRSAWSSVVYQALFWRVILERLELGEDVLHMDLDDIVVGDAWAPLAASDPSADIVGKPALNFAIGQEYCLYRSTPATKEVVRHFSSIWEEWLAGASSLPAGKPPLNAEQPAIGEYIKQYNPEGCSGGGSAPRTCKMHTGGTFQWQVPSSIGSVVQNGRCKFPEECRAKGAHISHSRSIIQEYCTPEEVYDAKHHP